MGKSIRVFAKEKFDSVAYRFGWLNRVLRTVNKKLIPFTNFRIRVTGTLHLNLNSGLKFKLATNETSAVAKKIFWNSPDKYEYTSIFERLVARCECFADIGANIGYYSVIAAKVNPTIKIYAFEPAPGPFHFLEKNIELNNLGSQISVFQLALSNRSGNLEFQEIGYSGHERTDHNLGGAGKLITEKKSQSVVIPVLVPSQIPDIFFEARFPLPDLIKMDTEGTENLIIEGMRELIRKQHPLIICETLFGVIERELDTCMREHGYHFYNFQNGKLTRTESLLREVDNGVSDCFFVHPDKEHLIQGFLTA